MEERLISFIGFANNRNLEYFNLLDILTCLIKKKTKKNRICKYLNINVFKHEESDKASVDSTHTLKLCGGELIDSPVVGVFHPPTIDAKYVQDFLDNSNSKGY